MIYLLVTSLIWGFSFGLIKAEVSTLHPILVAGIRLTLSALAFAPWLRRRPFAESLELMGIGFVQFGLMYCLYISAYGYLQGHEIAILTISTPFFVVLIDAAWARALQLRYWLAAAFALAGGAALVWQKAGGKAVSLELVGVLYIQVANLCFAAGQVWYKKFQSDHSASPDHLNFAWLYLGSIVAPALFLGIEQAENITWPSQTSQWLSLAYLGFIPSALGFYLWNKGVTKENYGVIAVMNNFKIPAAVLIAWLVFSENIDMIAVITSLSLLLVGNLIAHHRHNLEPEAAQKS